MRMIEARWTAAAHAAFEKRRRRNKTASSRRSPRRFGTFIFIAEVTEFMESSRRKNCVLTKMEV